MGVRPLIVGCSLPLTGKHEVQGEQARRGLELWRDAVRAKGGLSVGGAWHPLELHLSDDGSSRSRCARALSVLVDSGADVLLGPYGTPASLAAAEVATARGRVLWNHSGSLDAIARPLVVTLPTPASRYFEPAIDYARWQGTRRLQIAANDTRFGRAVASGAQNYARARGADVRMILVPPGAWDGCRNGLEEAIRGGAATLVCGALEDDIDTVAAFSDVRDRAFLCAVGAGVEAFGRSLGDRSEGIFGVSQWEPRGAAVAVGPTATEMADRYRARYGQSPDYIAVQAWACVALAEAALADAGTEPAATWRWATSFAGATGYGAFELDNRGRQIGHEMCLVRWREGRREVVAPPT